MTASRLAKKPSRTSAQDVYERLRREIADGLLGPGDALIEADLAARFDVSRTPVREVLLRLQQDGLANQGPRGMHVRERSRDEILDTYDARILLETQAARYAAQRHNEIDEVAMVATNERMRLMDRSDTSALARASLAYHEAIWTASHSRALYDLLARLQSHLAQFREVTLDRPGRAESAMHEHQQLLAAILSGDAESAATLAREHLIAGRDVRLAVWREQSSEQ